MRMEMSLRPRLEQRLRLAPQIIQSIEILQLPLMALLERIELEQNENPALEAEPEAETPDATPEAERPARIEEEQQPNAEENFSRLSDLSEEFRDYFWQTSSRRGDSDDGDSKREAIQNTPSQPATLHDHLLEQMRFLEVSNRTRCIAENIIFNIDRDGRLGATLEEIGHAMDESAERAELEEALAVVQSLEPRGIGACDLQECLLLQLDESHPQHELHRALILRHLKDIEHNRLPRVAKKLGVDMETLKQAVAYVCSMDPAPGRLYDWGQVPYMMTDVIVEMNDGRYEVYLNEGMLPRLRISPTYRRMIRHAKTGTEEHAFLKKKIESARWLVDAIQQRKDTLLKISREIVREQQDFLEKGIPGLKPMKMQDVADATGVHVSTVSRAISQKNIQTQWGIFPIKFFFSGGMKTNDGEDETWNAVKSRMKEIVASEDKKNPLSDEGILQKLSGAGLQIARRTVTKYRKLLKISSSRQRKQY